MPTPTYTLIDSVTLTSSASSVTFSSISATGKGDLVFVMDVLGSGANTTARYQFNSDTGANYSYVQMFGDGSTPQSYSGTQTRISELPASTTSRCLSVVQINDYAATNKHKTVLSRSNTGDYGVLAMASRWASTSAITSIRIFVTSPDFAAGSTFHLYQIVSE